MSGSMSIGTGLGLDGTLRRAGYEAETEALVARFTTPPTALRKGQIDTLIRALKAAGIWTRLDAFYMLAAADSQAARRNWIQDLYNATAVAAPTFTPDRGYAGDGSTSYLDTGFNPATATSPKFVLNSASMGVYSRTDVTDSQQFDAGNTNARFNCRSTIGPAFRGPMNDGTSFVATPANSTSLGMFALNRSGASARQGYVNGAGVGTDTLASTAVASENLTLLKGTFNYSTRQLAVGFFGQSLTAMEHAAFYAAVQTYLASVGA